VHTILVVDDEQSNNALLAMELEGQGFRVLQAGDGVNALELLRSVAIDLVITDILMPRMDGFELARHLRTSSTFVHIPIIFSTATYLEAEARSLADQCGVAFYLIKPTTTDILLSTVASALSTPVSSPISDSRFEKSSGDIHLQLITNKLYKVVSKLESLNEELEERVRNRTEELDRTNQALHAEIDRRRAVEEELKLTNIALSEQAWRDSLTQLYNRRFLGDALKREIARAERNGTSFAILLADIDNFKWVNDTCGHAGGDALLQTIGACLSTLFRGGDIVCRYGGEEFVILMPEISKIIALERAEQLLDCVRQMELPHEIRHIGIVTLSVGAAVFPDHARSQDDLLRSADSAMYSAKNSGKNRVIMSR
jgi:diguanylate cyclase (GGDEF)-like protein